jgi:hypothetical protein
MNPINRFGEAYIHHAKLAGALYCIVPWVAGFVGMFFTLPFREVYMLRLGLIVVIGGGIAAWLHEYGVKSWLVKHRSAEGPATVMDGAMIGAAVGLGIQILPSLTGLIGTNHPDEAKTIIIIIWIAGMVIGAFIGSLLAYMWGQYISRTGDASQAATRVKPQQ